MYNENRWKDSIGELHTSPQPKNEGSEIDYKLIPESCFLPLQVIMTQASHLYFDHPYEPDPEERGLYWATRYTDTRKAFGFMPEHLYDSIEINGDGRKIADYCAEGGDCVPPQKLDNIVGRW